MKVKKFACLIKKSMFFGHITKRYKLNFAKYVYKWLYKMVFVFEMFYNFVLDLYIVPLLKFVTEYVIGVYDYDEWYAEINY